MFIVFSMLITVVLKIRIIRRRAEIQYLFWDSNKTFYSIDIRRTRICLSVGTSETQSEIIICSINTLLQIENIMASKLAQCIFSLILLGLFFAQFYP